MFTPYFLKKEIPETWLKKATAEAIDVVSGKNKVRQI